jgi:hypothetical protein
VLQRKSHIFTAAMLRNPSMPIRGARSRIDALVGMALFVVEFRSVVDAKLKTDILGIPCSKPAPRRGHNRREIKRPLVARPTIYVSFSGGKTSTYAATSLTDFALVGKRGMP